MKADSEEGQEACGALGVAVLPTLQFWREGTKLWEHRGILHLQQDLGEGAGFTGNPVMDMLVLIEQKALTSAVHFL